MRTCLGTQIQILTFGDSTAVVLIMDLYTRSGKSKKGQNGPQEKNIQVAVRCRFGHKVYKRTHTSLVSLARPFSAEVDPIGHD